MKKLVVLAVLISSSALAAPFKIKPAGIAAADVSIRNVSKDSLSTFHYTVIEQAYPYIGIKAVKGPITAQAIKDACGIEVRDNLKTPGAAKFVELSKPTYYENAGTYFMSGKVDSQNSYGALIRGKFYCTSAFEGSAKGGTLYTVVDFAN